MDVQFSNLEIVVFVQFCKRFIRIFAQIKQTHLLNIAESYHKFNKA